MNPIAWLRSAADRFVRRARTEHELEEELAAHVQLRADDLERSGLPRVEAQRRARVEFGGRERVKEECRDAFAAGFVETLWRDFRFSLRVLRKSPGFTLVAVFTLALAIGANAVVFGILNALILRPIRLPQPESLYGIEHASQHSMYESYPDYVDLRDRNRSFEDLAGFTIEAIGLDTGETPVRTWAYAATGNFFDTLRIKPYLGRLFHASDERGPNSAPYAVLSYPYWHTHFNSDPGVIGRVVRVNKYPFTIIGVTPPDFRGIILFFTPDLYVPLVNQQQIEGRYTLDARAATPVFMSLGHLKPGVTPEQAAADLNSVGDYLESAHPKDHGTTRFVLARPGLYGNYMGAPMRGFLTALMLLAGLILLAACANLGSLFAARAADRSREVALRLALGANRLRILRQLLTEALLVALGGGAAGLWASTLLLRALALWRPLPKFPLNIPLEPDAYVYLVALGLALASGLLFGLVPARQVLRADPYQIVKAGPGAMAGRRTTVRDMLLVVQIAISAVLITSSIVAVRGLTRSLAVNYGFDPRHVMLADTDLAMARYLAPETPAVQKRMLAAVQSIPGVESAAIIGRVPLAAGGFVSSIYDDGTTDIRPSNATANAQRFHVSPGYFGAAGTPVLAGRDITWHDDLNAPRVAIVNREFARRVFGGVSNAIGARFKLRDGTRIQVAGVVENGKYTNLTEDPLLALFVPLQQMPQSEMELVIRSHRDSEQLATAIRAAVRGVDSALPLYVSTWERELDFALFPSHAATLALGVMGGMGAVLAITGLFGMAAYSVSKRLREIGIRMALGAQNKEVLSAALGRAMKLLAFGSAAGLVLGVLAARVLSSIVYQATPRDPVVLGGAFLVMSALGLLATWIPAHRALAANPLALLREE